MLREELKKAYLDYVNNFISTQAWADHWSVDSQDAHAILDIARKYYNEDYLAPELTKSVNQV